MSLLRRLFTFYEDREYPQEFEDYAIESVRNASSQETHEAWMDMLELNHPDIHHKLKERSTHDN